MPYSVHDFDSDLKIMFELSPEEWNLTEKESPHFQMEGKTYRVNMNHPLGYALQHFSAKYGRNAADNSFRFMKVCQFLFDHREELLEEKGRIVLPAEPDDPPGTFQVNQQFLDFLLSGFREPRPPVIFPTHPLLSKRGDRDFSFRKTMPAFRKWQKQETHALQTGRMDGSA